MTIHICVYREDVLAIHAAAGDKRKGCGSGLVASGVALERPLYCNEDLLVEEKVAVEHPQ